MRVNESEQLMEAELPRIDIVDRQELSEWVRTQYPRLTTEVIYGGLYFRKKDSCPPASWILLKNGRTVVSYNVETNRSHNRLKVPRGRGWMAKLQQSLAVRFERLWGETMELTNG